MTGEGYRLNTEKYMVENISRPNTRHLIHLNDKFLDFLSTRSINVGTNNMANIILMT
ncbi:hypothetical protein DSECCO2_602310 [anaerobic digester metagenome]